ncbi:hypothetical protein SNE40_019263 [Patella caerulea]
MLFSRRIHSDINVLRSSNINQDLIEFRPFKNQEINCKKIVEGDENEIKKFVERKPDNIPTNETLVKHTQNCSFFRRIYGYDAVLNTEEEKQFPIAFNILLYKEVEQVEILLRIIYRPQNYYCLHIDGFSPDHVHRAAKSLADCFNNVFIVSKTEKIVYESFQRLQADINCMSDHLDNPNWKYLINLPSQEYPIKSNAEIVQILKLLNDTNYTECIIGTGRLNIRYKFKYKNVYEPNGTYRIVKTNERYKDPPHRMVVVKGSAYGVFTRRFVDYVINTKLARDLLEWCRGVLSPDEYYWSTLNHNPHLHVPGSYKVKCPTTFLLSTYVIWYPMKCPGKFLRFVCIFGITSLSKLAKRKELFVNKFELEYSYPALYCLSEFLRNKSLSRPRIDEKFYKQLYFNQTNIV